VIATDTDRLSLADRTILAVFAHPDDESLACGGTIARTTDAGARVVLLCASRGERGQRNDPALALDGDLGDIRAGELRDAAAVLGIAEVIVLSHPDSALRWSNVPVLHNEIVEAIEHFRPDAIITFDEDGLYWHLDHVGVHERTTTAVLSLGREAPPLYYVTMPHGAMRGIVEAAQARGAPVSNSGVWGVNPDAFGLATISPTFVVDVRGWVGRKLTALRCHRTQMGPGNPLAWIDENAARRWLGYERFRRAPAEDVGASVLEPLARADGHPESTA
jgi:LmbE family N-acetylglucosaminyl deacetylase